MVVSINPDGVLAMSAATLLVSQNLSTSGTALQAEIDAVDHLVGRRPVFTSRVDATAGDLAELAGWARELVITYVDDERPISQLATMGFWLPDFSKLGWDGDLTAGQNLEKTARSDEFGAFVLGTGGALLERYRRFTLFVPREGAPLPSLNLPRPDVEWRGKPFITLPNGLVVPQGSSVDPEVKRLAALADDWHQPGKPTFVTNPGLGRPPTWAKVGGKALGVIGAGLTVYDSYMSQWEQDQKYHPEWGTDGARRERRLQRRDRGRRCRRGRDRRCADRRVRGVVHPHPRRRDARRRPRGRCHRRLRGQQGGQGRRAGTQGGRRVRRGQDRRRVELGVRVSVAVVLPEAPEPALTGAGLVVAVVCAVLFLLLGLANYAGYGRFIATSYLLSPYVILAARVAGRWHAAGARRRLAADARPGPLGRRSGWSWRWPVSCRGSWGSSACSGCRSACGRGGCGS